MPGIFLGDGPDLTLDKVKRLVADLTWLAARGCPSAGELTRAPLLDRWQIAGRSMPVLVGLAHDHLDVRTGRTSLTSLVLALDADAGWAHTWSRYYRLGRPANLKSGRSQ